MGSPRLHRPLNCLGVDPSDDRLGFGHELARRHRSNHSNALLTWINGWGLQLPRERRGIAGNACHRVGPTLSLWYRGIQR